VVKQAWFIGFILSIFSYSAYGEINIDKECADQFRVILNANEDRLTAGFFTYSLLLSDQSYAEKIIPKLLNDEAFAFRFGLVFTRQCLVPGLAIREVVSNMALMDEF